MFGKFLSSFSLRGQETDSESNRSYPRRKGDQCVSIIDGKIYPVEDWSVGGFLIAADDRVFGVEQEFDVTMKFRLRNSILDIPHKAKVVRKAQNRVALEFSPMTQKIKTGFQQVIDDFLAQGFADSQSH